MARARPAHGERMASAWRAHGLALDTTCTCPDITFRFWEPSKADSVPQISFVRPRALYESYYFRHSAWRDFKEVFSEVRSVCAPDERSVFYLDDDRCVKDSDSMQSLGFATYTPPRDCVVNVQVIAGHFYTATFYYSWPWRMHASDDDTGHDKSRAVCRIRRGTPLGSAIDAVFEEWGISRPYVVCILRTPSRQYTDPATWTRLQDADTMESLGLVGDFAIEVLHDPEVRRQAEVARRAACGCAHCSVPAMSSTAGDVVDLTGDD